MLEGAVCWMQGPASLCWPEGTQRGDDCCVAWERTPSDGTVRVDAAVSVGCEWLWEHAHRRDFCDGGKEECCHVSDE